MKIRWNTVLKRTQNDLLADFRSKYEAVLETYRLYSSINDQKSELVQNTEYQQLKNTYTPCSTRVVERFFLFWLKIFIFEPETTKKYKW